jgi:hypothetical protein
VIPGIVGSSQYVVPFSSIKEVNFGQSTSSASIPPVSDGYNYVVYDQAQSDIMSATPYPNSTYSDVYTTQVTTTTNPQNYAKYENGSFFITNTVNLHIYKFETVGGTISTGTLTAGARTVRWFAPMNAWVAGGVGGRIWTSTDGTTWTLRTSPAAFNINGMATDGTTLAVGGASGNIWTTTSTDSAAISWTQRTSSFGTTDLSDMEYHGGNWVAIAEAGKVAYSTNATTWTQKTTGGSTSKTCQGVTYHMGRWLIVTLGFLSNNGETIRSNTSDPSGSWTVVTSNQNIQCTRIFSDGRYAFWTIGGGKLRYSR